VIARKDCTDQQKQMMMLPKETRDGIQFTGKVIAEKVCILYMLLYL